MGADRDYLAWTPEDGGDAPAENGSVGPAGGQAASQAGGKPTESAVVQALSTVYDPEIPVDIYELGLIYDVSVGDDGQIDVTMTLTSPGCPVAEEMPAMVETAVRQVPGVTGVDVEITWDPPWTPDMMSEAAKLELGFF